MVGREIFIEDDDIVIHLSTIIKGWPISITSTGKVYKSDIMLTVIIKDLLNLRGKIQVSGTNMLSLTTCVYPGKSNITFSKSIKY